jgi:hypothetical protein
VHAENASLIIASPSEDAKDPTKRFVPGYRDSESYVWLATWDSNLTLFDLQPMLTLLIRDAFAVSQESAVNRKTYRLESCVVSQKLSPPWIAAGRPWSAVAIVPYKSP